MIASELPEPLDPVSVERGVGAYEREIIRQRLGYQHPVKRVAVVHFEMLEMFNMRGSDGQERCQSLILDQSHQCIELYPELKLSEPHLNGDLPQ